MENVLYLRMLGGNSKIGIERHILFLRLCFARGGVLSFLHNKIDVSRSMWSPVPVLYLGKAD
jgi:hypothetical protein